MEVFWADTGWVLGIKMQLKWNYDHIIVYENIWTHDEGCFLGLIPSIIPMENGIFAFLFGMYQLTRTNFDSIDPFFPAER